ncbi:MAG TPA: TIGR03564 family F420-dependent LLM class oxidoreductase [Acidimicrobiales bacterium]
MRISTTVGVGLDGPQTAADITAEVRRAADLGLAGAWWPQLFGWDALTSLAVAGVQVPGIPLGTAVVPTYPRHPLVLASQALSAQAAVGNRLTLGLGPSHRHLVEDLFGYRFDRPARHTRELLEVLGPLLRGEAVEHRGEAHHVVGQVVVPGAEPPRVLLAALGPVMLGIAGELADGTVATWTGVRTVGHHIVPRLVAAAERAGRPAPEVVVSLPLAVTTGGEGGADAARAWVAERFGVAGDMPSYRAMLDLEGVAGVDEVVIAGDEASVERQLRSFADAGATEMIAVPFGPPDQVDRTLALLSTLNAAAGPAQPAARAGQPPVRA